MEEIGKVNFSNCTCDLSGAPDVYSLHGKTDRSADLCSHSPPQCHWNVGSESKAEVENLFPALSHATRNTTKKK